MTAFIRLRPLYRPALRSVVQFGTAVGRAWLALEHVMEVWQQQRALSTLDERMLKDIGITRAQARYEASRFPPWLFHSVDTRGDVALFGLIEGKQRGAVQPLRAPGTSSGGRSAARHPAGSSRVTAMPRTSGMVAQAGGKCFATDSCEAAP